MTLQWGSKVTGKTIIDRALIPDSRPHQSREARAWTCTREQLGRAAGPERTDWCAASNNTNTHTGQIHNRRLSIVRTCLSRKQSREWRGNLTMKSVSEELLGSACLFWKTVSRLVLVGPHTWLVRLVRSTLRSRRRGGETKSGLGGGGAKVTPLSPFIAFPNTRLRASQRLKDKSDEVSAKAPKGRQTGAQSSLFNSNWCRLEQKIGFYVPPVAILNLLC